MNYEPPIDDPISLEGEGEEWGICYTCNDDFLVEEHEQSLCKVCHDKELENE